MIELRRLCKTYVTKHGAFEALNDINLTVRDGDIHGIIGVSGAGKSTLVRCVNLLERPTSGNVIIDGEDVTGFKGRQLLDLRAKIGMIFQDFSLFAQRTALANVTFPLEIRRDSKAVAEKRAIELLELVGLSDKAKSYPSQLSGGQQQRVAIARALANRPRYLLCDEATSALDSLTTDSILELLQTINHELGVTILVITHEMKVIQTICNKVAVLDGARIVERGLTSTVFANPQQEITRRLLGQAAAEAALREATEATVAASASINTAIPTDGMPADSMPAEALPPVAILTDGMPAEAMPADVMPADGMPPESTLADGMTPESTLADGMPPEAVNNDV
ncbi:MAG: ATP-binding cassette domain-containing protein [Coriobacteriales bacterium]|jgi:D-methionine transport system ATP-binding protein|nr:ATP-binding cassette domain-containing protein [Coriobacteriales bacterium]